MSMRIRRHQGTKGRGVVLTATLVASMMLVACQPGAPEPSSDPSAEDVARESDGSTDGRPQSNVEPSQGGAVVSSDVPAPDEEAQVGLEGLWLLDKVVNGEGTEDVLSTEDISRYDTAYELVCAIQLYHDDEAGEEFVCSLPGIDMIGTWIADSETGASLIVPLSEDVSIIGKCELSIDRSKMAVMFPSGDEAADVIYMFSRDDGTTSLGETYEALIEQNDKFYNELPVDDELDVTFADTDDVTMRLVGTTHSTEGNLIGYLIDVTNKTDAPLVINDFLDGLGGTPFSVNGLHDPALALTARVLPPTMEDEDGNAMTATMRCAILFSQDEVGEFLTSCSGELVVTDYHWNEVRRYPFSV